MSLIILLLFFRLCSLFSQDFPGIYTCSDDDGLDTIFDTIRKSRVHRLIVVDDQFRLKGVLTLSDILKYILLEGEQEGW
jgi:5'-AMP-activated protein kinase, regulatory gamma subunit